MKRTVGILSGILAFLTIMFGVCLLLTIIGWPIGTARQQELIAGLSKMPTALFLVLFALLCVAAGIIVLYGMIGNHMKHRTTALLEKNALGETAVSFTAVAQIVEHTLKNRNDVRRIKTKVYAVGNSIRIDVHAVTSPAVSLLKMTHALQEEINAAILAYCGTAVGSVDVTIDQADLPPKRI